MNAHPPSPVPVFLVDDHPMVRQGLALVLEQGGFAICGEGDSPAAALSHPGFAAAKIVIIDLSLGGENGADLIPALWRRGVHIVVYSMHEDAAVVRRVLAAGAAGYVTKREAAHSLVEAIKTVLDGRTYISPRAAEALARATAEPGLSDQQRQLYALLGQGFDTEEIAARLQVSPRTVETYCTRMMEKMSVTGMKELRRRAIADHQKQPF
jgi:DNA-binding NarL/FixJ family response regulator